MMALCREISGGQEDVEQIMPFLVLNSKGK